MDFSILGNTVAHMRRKAFCLGKYFGGCCGYERSLPCIDFRENNNARRMSAGWGMGERRRWRVKKNLRTITINKIEMRVINNQLERKEAQQKGRRLLSEDPFRVGSHTESFKKILKF